MSSITVVRYDAPAGVRCWHHTPGKPSRKGDCRSAPGVRLSWPTHSGLEGRYESCLEHLTESVVLCLKLSEGGRYA